MPHLALGLSAAWWLSRAIAARARRASSSLAFAFTHGEIRGCVRPDVSAGHEPQVMALNWSR
jgi:hypothetical protein